MRRVVVLVVAALALMLLPMQPTLFAQLNLIQVTLTCSDGTEITDTVLMLDSASLAALQSAVDAMTLYPAGLTCRLTQQLTPTLGGLFGPVAAFAQSGNPTWDYAVGGGRAFIVNCSPDQFTNFGFSARVHPSSDPSEAQGTFNLTVPECSLNTSSGVQFFQTGSHLGTQVDCLQVIGGNTNGTANLRALVLRATGLFETLFPAETCFPANAPPACHIAVQVVDSGAQDGFGDMIGWNPSGGEVFPPDFPCATASTQPIEHGDISVHKAQ